MPEVLVDLLHLLEQLQLQAHQLLPLVVYQKVAGVGVAVDFLVELFAGDEVVIKFVLDPFDLVEEGALLLHEILHDGDALLLVLFFPLLDCREELLHLRLTDLVVPLAGVEHLPAEGHELFLVLVVELLGFVAQVQQRLTWKASSLRDG